MPFTYVPLRTSCEDPAQHSSSKAKGPNTVVPAVLNVGQTITVPGRYMIDLTSGPLLFQLPAANTIEDGACVSFVDLLGLANVNNITVQPFQGDTINVRGTVEPTFVISRADTVTEFYLLAGVWRPFQYAA